MNWDPGPKPLGVPRLSFSKGFAFHFKWMNESESESLLSPAGEPDYLAGLMLQIKTVRLE